MLAGLGQTCRINGQFTRQTASPMSLTQLAESWNSLCSQSSRVEVPAHAEVKEGGIYTSKGFGKAAGDGEQAILG